MIRLAISLGGDSDTQAAIAGGIAHGLFLVTSRRTFAVKWSAGLPEEFRDILDEFSTTYR